MLIIDVREVGEFAVEHIPGSVNLPMSQVQEKSKEFLASHAGSQVVIMCGAGVRAEKVRQFWVASDLIDETEVEVYPGGLRRWKAEGKPVSCARS